MIQKFFILKTLTPDATGNMFLHSSPENIEAVPHLSACIAHGKKFSATANELPVYKTKAFRGRPNFTAILSNTASTIFMRKDCASVFQENNKDDIQTIPIHIQSAQGKALTDDYVILNPLRTIDCLDYNKSEIKYSKKNREEVIFIGKKVISKSKVEDLPLFFRIQDAPREYAVALAMILKLKGLDLSNLFFSEIEISE